MTRGDSTGAGQHSGRDTGRGTEKGAGQGTGQGASGEAPLAEIAAALRRERTRAELSLTEVARRAGIAKSTLSQLEAGTGNPSLETLWALCVALDIPIGRLLAPARPSVHVVRAGEGAAIASSQADYQATLLTACPPGARRDVFRITAEPGHQRDSDPHMPGVVEHVILSTGRALVGTTEATVELHPGDYVTYPADVPHVFQALEPGTQAVFVSEHT
ncbi:XRE family transcriptional regulator [Streptomyces albiaxialis]|uniref:XRE family transcriptional regulator n=1 Tax=Streptomyces albiaxialis TaxID=329523 RepID=A0ABN2W4J8_9ACTN